MAYDIVKQTGGYVFVESIVVEGCYFILLLLAHSEPNPNKSGQGDRVSRTAAPVPAAGIVLLVEDESRVPAFAARALRLRGYMVLEANCGERALEVLEDVDLWVDIFVTDVIMPELDCPTWVLQALLNRPKTQVIFMSGYAQDYLVDQQAVLRGSVFLPKPFWPS